MIDTTTETLIPVRQVPEDYPSCHSGKKINHSTVWRWCMRGLRGIRLETVVIGGGRYTSKEAVQRFAVRRTQAQSNPAGDCADSPAAPRTTARRRRDDQRAAAELDRMGA